jgi:hypothetical protein
MLHVDVQSSMLQKVTTLMHAQGFKFYRIMPAVWEVVNYLTLPSLTQKCPILYHAYPLVHLIALLCTLGANWATTPLNFSQW